MINFPNIDPTILTIYKGMAIRWYNLSYIIGILLTVYFFNKNFKHKKLKNQPSDIVFSIAVYAIIFARLGFVFLYYYKNFLQDWSVLFKIWEGGMSFFGGFLGVVIGTLVNAKRNNLKFFEILDIVFIPITIGVFLGRISNFINSELYGIPTNVSWCVIFPTDESQLCRHPSQIYEAFFEGFVLFLIGFFMYKKSIHKKKQGLITLTMASFYCVFRFFIEFFRNEDIGYGLKMKYISQGQLFCIIAIIISIFTYFYNKNKCKK